MTVEDFMKTATSEQKLLLHKIGVLAEEEKKYVDEINNINKSTESGIYSSDGLSVTVCEDKDDARILSMKPQENLKGVRKQIKISIEKAAEIGMEHLEFIQRNYEHYVGKPLQ